MGLPNILGANVALLLAAASVGCHDQAPPAASAGSVSSVARAAPSVLAPLEAAPSVTAPEAPGLAPKASEQPVEDAPTIGLSTPKPPTASLDELFLFVPLKIPPDQRPPNPEGLEDLWLTSSDGTKLHAWWLAHPQPVAHVLYLHGNSGNLWKVAGYLKWLHDVADCAVLSVDYRGYGLSDGAPTVGHGRRAIRTARPVSNSPMRSPYSRQTISRSASLTFW